MYIILKRKVQYNFSAKKSLKDHLVTLPLKVMTKCTEGTSLAHSAFLKLPLDIQFKIPLSIPQGHSEPTLLFSHGHCI